jgi:molybdopterin-guanine dinucleotide biosynthesis protein A
MGQDKLRMVLPDGQQLVERAARSLATCCGTLLAARRRDSALVPLAGFDHILDAESGVGPLAGLTAALDRAATPWLLVAGGDMPELDEAFLRSFMALAEQDDHRAMVIGRGRHLESLPLAVPRALAAQIQNRFAQGERALRRAVPAARLRVVDPDDLRMKGSALPWLSLNTPEDWQAYTGEPAALPA